jgi:hypothetical protein
MAVAFNLYLIQGEVDNFRHTAVEKNKSEKHLKEVWGWVAGFYSDV